MSSLERISHSLRLAGDAGVIVLAEVVDDAGLGDLVRHLEAEGDLPRVCASNAELMAAESGSVVVLAPALQELEALNLARPMLERRRLKLILWCDAHMRVELQRRAPDVFDWISHRVVFAAQVAPHVRRALTACARGRVGPGLVWRGEAEHFLAAASALGISAGRLSSATPYAKLVAKMRATPASQWICFERVGRMRTRRIRWALAEAAREEGAAPRVVLVKGRAPGWMILEPKQRPLAEAMATLSVFGPDAGLAAALLDLEAEAVEWTAALLAHGMPAQDLLFSIRQENAPAEVVAALALECGALDASQALLAGSALLRRLRPASAEGQIDQSVWDDLLRGRAPEERALGWWATRKGEIVSAFDTLPLMLRPYLVERALRSTDPELRRPCVMVALELGDADIASRWEATLPASPATRALRFKHAADRAWWLDDELERAVRLYRHVLDVQPFNAALSTEACLEMARLLEVLGQPEQAERALRRLEARQSDPRLRAQRGLILMRAGDFDEPGRLSEGVWERSARAHDAANMPSEITLAHAWWLWAHGRLEEACASLEPLHARLVLAREVTGDITPEAIRVSTARTLLCSWLGSRSSWPSDDETRELLAAASTGKHVAAQISLNLGRAQLNQGSAGAAAELARAALHGETAVLGAKSIPALEATLLLGRAESRLGRPKRARTLLAAAQEGLGFRLGWRHFLVRLARFEWAHVAGKLGEIESAEREPSLREFIADLPQEHPERRAAEALAESW